MHSAAKTGKKSAEKEFKEAVSAIDKAVKKGVIHKNKAARTKSKLAAAFKKSGGKVTKSTEKKAPAKAKTAAKKTAAKKPVAKAKTAPKKKPAKKK